MLAPSTTPTKAVSTAARARLQSGQSSAMVFRFLLLNLVGGAVGAVGDVGGDGSAGGPFLGGVGPEHPLALGAVGGHQTPHRAQHSQDHLAVEVLVGLGESGIWDHVRVMAPQRSEEHTS